MGNYRDFLPIGAILLPMLATLPLYFIGKISARSRDWFAILVTAVTLVLVAAMYPAVRDGGQILLNYPGIFPPFGLSFMVDILGFTLAIISAFIWFLATIYSKEYMSKEHATGRFYPFWLLSLSGCLGVFLTGDLFSLFLFFELMSLTAYVLVVHEETPDAIQAGYKYLILTLAGGLILFLGIIVTYEVASTVSLTSGILFTQADTLALVAFIAYLIGFGMKMGIFPLHIWLPDAHPVAPSPASAILSGIMLKTGAYGMLRIIYQIFGVDLIQNAGWHNILLILAALTIFIGSAVAIAQVDLKRRLAYSSIGQMGYILLGMALLNENGLTGDIFHILSHAIMKSTLFLAAGAIIYKTGKKRIDELKGIGYQMPVTMACFTVAALAMTGIPPLNGFVSKILLSIGALEAGYFYYVILLILSGLMNGIYWMPIIIAAFFGRPDSEIREFERPAILSRWRFNELSLGMLVPMMLLAVACFTFGLLPGNLPLRLSEAAARMLLGWPH